MSDVFKSYGGGAAVDLTDLQSRRVWLDKNGVSPKSVQGRLLAARQAMDAAHDRSDHTAAVEVCQAAVPELFGTGVDLTEDKLDALVALLAAWQEVMAASAADGVPREAKLHLESALNSIGMAEAIIKRSM